jgi:uncharacterized protein YdaU (DUF1376 family)
VSKKKDLWMPIYIGDYLADTGHLTTTQHGAYLLLLMHYWRKRELPTEDKQLAAIAKLPLRIWLDSKETIQDFFYDGWKHKRIEAELQTRREVAEKRAAAGYKGGMRTQMNHMLRGANAPVCLSKTHTQRNITSTESGDGKGLGEGREDRSAIPVSSELAASVSRFKQ